MYSQYKETLQKVADLKYAAAVLQWDQETYMPVKSAARRAGQVATLTEKAHALFTSDETGNLLLQLMSTDNLQADEEANVALSLYDYNKQKKLSPAFVHTLSEATSISFQSWVEARKADDFRLFEKDLNRIIELKKQEAAQLGYDAHPYNALLNEYERGCTVDFLDGVFNSLHQPLQRLLDKISRQPQVDNSFLHQRFSKEQQWKFGIELLGRLGFDFEAGRQDISAHPFTTNFSSTDVRVTTRLDEHDYASMTWSCIHEAGHALYEQGLPDAQYGLPLGEYASLGIHESQSRIWENNVGRSASFWNAYLPSVHKHFPDQFGTISATHFYKGINKVQPTLIRTEADELTYHYHVIIRYEVEKRLIEGSLKTSEIPSFWNEEVKKHLNIIVPGDAQGCLQDVHWSHGSFGYFPTYSLGSLYAAQFFSAAQKQLPGLEADLQHGHTDTLLQWLREKIHRHGRKFLSSRLCENLTGEPLNIGYFMAYAENKYRDIYNFTD